MSARSPSFSEGEISGANGDGEKVTRNASRRTNTNVDSSARPMSSSRASYNVRQVLMGNKSAHFDGSRSANERDRSRSPYRRKRSPPRGTSRSRSRSPYRADRDTVRDKRPHQDDHYGRNASDTRRHKPMNFQPARWNGSHNPDRHNSHGRHDRDRSRSPYRASVHTDRRPSLSDRSHANGSFDARKMTNGTAVSSASATGQGKHGSVANVANPGSMQGSEVTEEPTPPEPQLSEAEIIEQRRKARQAIRKKHAAAGGNESLLRTTLESNLPSTSSSPQIEPSPHGSETHSPPSTAQSPTPLMQSSTPGSPASPASPADLIPADDADLANPVHVNATNEEQGQSAADYDPNQDMNEDRPDHKRTDIQPSTEPFDPPEKSTDDFDMFADDDIDMFAVDDSALASGPSKQGKQLDESMLDNWDYPDGHYRIINGELLGGRYAVEQQVGKGTFATVVRARDADTGTTVAIKIACKNDTMLKAGQKEMQFLELLNEKDKEDKKHIIRLLGQFTHKGHLCLVFEGLSMDLREAIKKFGRDVGITMQAVKLYAYQMFQALVHMKSAEVLHADLKPDNILVSENKKYIKVCDFGTATLHRDAELTPYLVSRFYRAPEVILGMDFDYAIDMWAIGCTLYELFTGRILFNGADNNGMLRSIQECRGKIPIRLIKRAQLAHKYFDDTFTFHALERDKFTGHIVPRPVQFSQGAHGKDLKSKLSANLKLLPLSEVKEHNAFVDLLDKCLQLDPEKRIKPKDALHHPFFAAPQMKGNGKVPVTSSAALAPISVQHN
ncbi:serine/threonine-protein kinase prp4 [Zymoseptoria brevis]|uniref:non-specific serine/threonine protein kinase n=1 Tax=Zymoseptoria brevis TaxID=1047168 RepID=A0A0F4GI59_9PEZI|nr:serine/threonine-protein kinase prp4 [Zymoseptoria brevis]